MSLKIAYISLSLLMMFIIIAIGIHAIKKAFNDRKTISKKMTILLFGLLFWQFYVWLVSSTSIMENYSFPPRFALLLIFPLFIFTGIFIYRNRKADWINVIPPHWLIFFQTFRILVESLFVFSVAQGFLNREVTIEGYNYDFIFAMTAPIIGLLLWKKIICPKLVIIWNCLGLLVIASIIFLFISSIYNSQLFGSEEILLPIASVKYPYVLIAGFLMPLAVFVHILSIVQLRRR